MGVVEVPRHLGVDFGTSDQEVDLGGTYFHIDSKRAACFPAQPVGEFARVESLRKRTL